MEWLIRNLRYITIVLLILFLFKHVQSCNRKMATRIVQRNLTEQIDSIQNNLTGQIDSIILEKNNIVSKRNITIDSLRREIITREYIINDLSAELRIAGVRVSEAQRRAEAIERSSKSIEALIKERELERMRDSLNKIE